MNKESEFKAICWASQGELEASKVKESKCFRARWFVEGSKASWEWAWTKLRGEKQEQLCWVSNILH